MTWRAFTEPSQQEHDLAVQNQAMRCHNTGFTLIEVLVIVAIIAVLAAVLFPVFASAKQSAQKTICASNQRQIGQAFMVYAADNDDCYPNNGDPYLWVGKRWRWPVMTYIGAGQRQGDNFSAKTSNPSIFLCPSDTIAGSAYDATSYAYSASFYHSPEQINAMRIRNTILSINDPGPGATTLSQRTTSVAEPTRKALLTEWFNNHDFGQGGRVGFWGKLKLGLVPGDDRWQGSRILLFADGHVRLTKATRQTPSAENCPDINLTPNGILGIDLKN